MAEIKDLSATDANNTARFPEFMAPSAVNNAARALEGIIARWYKDTNASIVTSGTLPAYAVSLNENLVAYYDGLVIGAEIHDTNDTVDPTINANSIGATTIVRSGGLELRKGDLQAGHKYFFVYNEGNTEFEVLNPSLPSVGSYYGGVAGGTATALTATVSPVPVEYEAGMIIMVMADSDSTGAATIDVNSLGTQDIKRRQRAIVPTDWLDGDLLVMVHNGTYFELLSPSRNDPRGCALTNTTTQTITSGVLTAITFDTEAFDTDAMHDGSSNTNRITIPSGVTMVRFTSYAAWNSNSVNLRYHSIYKNGVTVVASDERNAAEVSSSTIVVDNYTVTAGDYYDVRVLHNVGSGLGVAVRFTCAILK